MIISQAIYTSANAKLKRGYHLVAQSPGILEHVAQGLCRWSPSHGCLSEERIDAESLCLFSPARGYYSISRSVYGCPEFSQRGGMRIVTVHLVFQVDQLARFQNNPATCARLALAFGLLTLPLEMPGVLPSIEFPGTSRNRRSDAFDSGPYGSEPIDLDEIRFLLRSDKSIALVGSDDPLAILEFLLESTPADERLDVSFATGLKPSSQRPFRVQFFQNADSRLKHELGHQGISVRNWPQPAAQRCL